MKPLLTNSTPNLMETMPRFCLPLSRLLTTTEQIEMVINKKIFKFTINAIICFKNGLAESRYSVLNNESTRNLNSQKNSIVIHVIL